MDNAPYLMDRLKRLSEAFCIRSISVKGNTVHQYYFILLSRVKYLFIELCSKTAKNHPVENFHL